VEDAGQSFAPIEDLARSDVACAKHSRDFVRGDHFSIFGWDLRAAKWDMEISEHQRKLAHLLLFSHVDRIYNDIKS